MSEMIERVARAIYEYNTLSVSGMTSAIAPGRYENADEDEKEHARGYARTAIAAMREPTKAMCKAGSERHMVSNLEEEAKIKYQWMIDEALKKK